MTYKYIFFSASVLVITLILFVTKAFSLTAEEVLNDIKNIPSVKIIVPNTELQDKKKVETKNFEQIKTVQVFVLPNNKEEINDLFVKWKKSGVNTIIVRVFHNEGDRYHYGIKSSLKEGVYFKTKEAPLIYDILEDIIPTAKRHGLKVFAWMTTRYADYDNNDLDRIKSFSFSEKRVLKTKGLNIFAPSVQQYLYKLFQDLASYPVDGILLQDDLFLRHNEGFNSSTVAFYKAETEKIAKPELFFIKNGKNISYTDEFWVWRRWKSKKIADFVSALNKNIKSVNPNIKLIVNLTYEALSNPKGALAWLAHDLQALKDSVDYFSLMAYHRQIMEELNLDFPNVQNYLANMVNQCLATIPDSPQRFIFKLQVKDWNTNQPIDEQEIRAVITSSKGLDSLSVAVVPYPPDLSSSLLKEIFGKNRFADKK